MKLSLLSRLSKQDEADLKNDFENILHWIDSLKSVDVSDVDEQFDNQYLVEQSDISIDTSVQSKEILSCANSLEYNMFKVSKVIDA